METSFFDLDRTLYAFNVRHRLPEPARLSSASQYQIASTWWAGGFEIRALSMTRIDATVAALRRAAVLGTVCLPSNNPSPLGEALPLLAPEVYDIMGGNAHNAFFVDDSLANVEGARSMGLTAHHVDDVGDAPQTATLLPAIEAFAGRNR